MRIYIDISCFCRTNYRAGIQRVLREVLGRLLRNDGLSISLLRYEETVRTFRQIDPDVFLEWLVKFDGALGEDAFRGLVDLDDFAPGEVFFDLDAAWVSTWRRSDLYPRLRASGVKVVSYVYDIIPYTNPEVLHLGFVTNFLYYLGAVLQYSDVILASTQSTLDEIAALQRKLGLRKTRSRATWLGADFRQDDTGNAPSAPNPAAVLAASGRYVLMVGTVQPLKNHAVVLDAFDKYLFNRGLNLVIAGKIGWKVEALERRIREHRLLGRQLFLLEGMDDTTIDYLYDNAFCVAFATLREGFGLPTIEAFQHGTPVIASDIPVLREVGGQFCRYFDPHSPDSFLDAISPLLSSEDEYAALRKKVSTYRPVTWDEVAACIGDILLGATSSPLAGRISGRLFRTFRMFSVRPPTVSFGDGDTMFADVNLGSPICLHHQCHSGLSIDMNGNVWTEGNETVIRVKVHGDFAHGLCLAMDFSTFNGDQKAILHVNDVYIGDIDSCARSSRVFSIPASCIGQDKTLSIHMDIPGAVSPDSVVGNGDKRLLALKIYDMRLFDEDGYFACRCGENLYFGEENGAAAVQYCLKGVSHPEKEFTWTNGQEMTMRFHLFGRDGMPKFLTMHYKTYLTEERVIAVINETKIAEFSARGEEKRTFDIPHTCAAADDNMELTLFLPDAISPKKLGHSPDNRKLALKLFSIRFDYDDYFTCRCGEDLPFGPEDGAVAIRYCLEGVSHPEQNFTWTNGEKLVMRFAPCDCEGPTRSLTLHYGTFLSKEHVTIIVNDTEIDSFIASGDEKKTFEIPEKLVSENGRIQVTLLLPDATSPSALNKGADNRLLALRLFSVRLD